MWSAEIQTFKVGDFFWHIEAQNTEDFWLDANGGPGGSPSLGGRAFPKREGRRVSQPIDIEQGKAHLFSALIALNYRVPREDWNLFSLMIEEKRKPISTVGPLSGTIIGHSIKRIVLRFAVWGPEGNSSGEAVMAQAKFSQSVHIEAKLTAKGNIPL